MILVIYLKFIRENLQVKCLFKKDEKRRKEKKAINHLRSTVNDVTHIVIFSLYHVRIQSVTKPFTTPPLLKCDAVNTRNLTEVQML